MRVKCNLNREGSLSILSERQEIHQKICADPLRGLSNLSDAVNIFPPNTIKILLHLESMYFTKCFSVLSMGKSRWLVYLIIDPGSDDLAAVTVRPSQAERKVLAALWCLQCYCFEQFEQESINTITYQTACKPNVDLRTTENLKLWPRDINITVRWVQTD